MLPKINEKISEPPHPPRIEKKINQFDAFIWTFRNNSAVLKNPKAYGWVDVDSNEKSIRLSCKKTISYYPLNDHAVIGADSTAEFTIPTSDPY